MKATLLIGAAAILLGNIQAQPTEPAQSPPVKTTSPADDRNKAEKGKPEETKTVLKESIHVSNPDQDNPRPKDWNKNDAEMVQEILSMAKQGSCCCTRTAHG